MVRDDESVHYSSFREPISTNKERPPSVAAGVSARLKAIRRKISVSSDHIGIMEDREIITAKVHRALELVHRGSFRKAEQTYRAAIKQCREDYSHLHILIFLQERLAFLLCNCNQNDEAAELRKHVFGLRVEMLGFDDPELLKKAALFCLTKQNIDDTKAKYPDLEDNYDYIFAYSKFLALHAAVLRDLGHPQVAILLFRDALGICSSSKTQFPATFIALQKAEMASAFIMLDRLSIAKNMAIDAHNSLGQILGPQHPDTLYSALVLAMCERQFYIDVRYEGACVVQPLELAIRFLAHGMIQILTSNDMRATSKLASDSGTTAAQGEAAEVAEEANSNISSMLSSLLEFNIDLGETTKNYGNTLHAAVCAGHYSTVQDLVYNYADLHVTSGLFGTALRAALIHGHIGIVRLLVMYGANPNLRIEGTASPLQIAVQMNDVGLIRALMRFDEGDTNANDYLFGDLLQEAYAIGDPVLVDCVKAAAEGGLFKTTCLADTCFDDYLDPEPPPKPKRRKLTFKELLKCLTPRLRMRKGTALHGLLCLLIIGVAVV